MSNITPYYRTVTELLSGRSFAIDEYQREYKWDRQNVEELLSDLTASFRASYRPGDSLEKAATYGEYFLGSIIVTPRNGKHFLVDGQQRVTSLTLLLINLYRASVALSLDVAATIQPLIYSNQYGTKKFNLDVDERRSTFEALFNGHEPVLSGGDESAENLVARYNDIEQSDLVAELGDGFESFVYWLLGRVGLIEISTSSDEHANAIFETMNDRGKPLSPVDMLKAYLLGPITEPQSRRQANDTWKRTVVDLISWGDDLNPERDSNAIKAWLRAQHADSVRERRAGAGDRDWELLGSNFHRWVRDNAARVGTGHAEANLRFMTEDFPFYGRVYREILTASSEYTRGLEPVFYNAKNEFTWQNTVLLAPLIATDDPPTIRKKLGIVASYIDIWLMRRVVNYTRVTYSSSAYAMFLLVKDIRRATPEELVELLTKRLDDDDFSFTGASDRERAGRERSGLSALALNQWSKRYIFHILARVTAHVETQSGMPDRFAALSDRSGSNGYDIEHLWPDDFESYASEFESEQEFARSRNNIAGLVLLPASLNRSLQAKPFEEKAPYYAKDNLYAASLTAMAYEHAPQFLRYRDTNGHPFRPYESFGRKEQSERLELLSSLVEEVWSPSRLATYLD